MTSTILLNALQYLGYILIFPGFLFCFLTGMLLCGIDRKLVARMQKRVGPPILQPFYDFFKLCGKETIVPAAANKTVFLMAPLVGLAALVVLQLFIPIFVLPRLRRGGGRDRHPLPAADPGGGHHPGRLRHRLSLRRRGPEP